MVGDCWLFYVGFSGRNVEKKGNQLWFSILQKLLTFDKHFWYIKLQEGEIGGILNTFCIQVRQNDTNKENKTIMK